MRRFYVILALSACGHESPAPPTPTPPPSIVEAAAPAPIASTIPSGADPTLDALDRIDDEAAWRRLAAPSDEHAIARTEVVKLLLDRTRGTLAFCQSVRWPLHYDYVLHVHPEERAHFPDMRTFMTRNYLRDDRTYVMASLVRFLDADVVALELGPADTLAPAEIEALVAEVRAHTFFGERLRYHPRSERQIREANDAEMSVLDTDALWRGVRYQPVTLGRAIGRVVFVEGALDPSTLRGDEILVLAQTPDDLPPVRALVTEALQTPLAHVAVLSASRGTPDMAQRGVMDDATWRAFEGRFAALVVDARGFSLTAVTQDDTPRTIATRTLPIADRDARDLVDLDALSLDDLPRVGAKAAQLGEVRRLGLPTLDGFAIPTGWYLAHVASPAIGARTIPDRDTRTEALAALRARIEAAPVDPALLDALASRARTFGSQRVILRSSTNAEDLPGWSGAGLYASVVADASDRASLAHALAEVWASVYTLRAYDERALAGVDHEAVAMAVLVQPFLEDARALGVVVTENPYASHRAAYLVDLAPRGSSVTATVDDRPEEWLLYLHSAPELVHPRSAGGPPLLDAPTARTLRDQLGRLHEGLRARWLARDPSVTPGAVDAEIALDAHGRVLFLQARPYATRR